MSIFEAVITQMVIDLLENIIVPQLAKLLPAFISPEGSLCKLYHILSGMNLTRILVLYFLRIHPLYSWYFL